MIRRKLFFIGLVASLFIIAGCRDLIEPNLAHKTFAILAPANNGALSNTSVTFWWDTLQGATQYEVQVVKPSFQNILYLVVDSYVVGNKLFYNVPPGSYQWRIRALNSSSSTDFFVSSFSVDSSLNLTSQTVLLNSPINNYTTNKLTISFKWNPIFYATSYWFEILNSAGTQIYVNPSLIADTISYTFTSGDIYTWRVRALNNSSASPFTAQTLNIDITTPSIPTSLTPLTGDSIANPFTLGWAQATDNGSFIFDSLYIYSDSTQLNAVRTIRPSAISYTDSLVAGNYYWKLRAIDSAGNYSPYTSLYKFITH